MMMMMMTMMMTMRVVVMVVVVVVEVAIMMVVVLRDRDPVWGSDDGDDADCGDVYHGMAVMSMALIERNALQVMGCRRRLQARWQETPLSRLFSLRSEFHLLKHQVMVMMMMMVMVMVMMMVMVVVVIIVVVAFVVVGGGVDDDNDDDDGHPCVLVRRPTCSACGWRSRSVICRCARPSSSSTPTRTGSSPRARCVRHTRF
jgi:hypothetical protein